jgi:DNA repair protein RadC
MERRVDACPLLIRTAATFRPGPPGERLQIGDPTVAVDLVRPLLDGRDRECGVLVALDTKHRVIATTIVSIGTVAHTFFAPREVFRDALLFGASAIVVAHNHPSGDATPSSDDRQITRRLAQAGATLGVELLDHLVLGDPDWTSLAQLGVC